VHGGRQFVDGPVALGLQQFQNLAIYGIQFLLHGCIVEKYASKQAFDASHCNFMLQIWWQTSVINPQSRTT
jgi:hypothetical protein